MFDISRHLQEVAYIGRLSNLVMVLQNTGKHCLIMTNCLLYNLPMPNICSRAEYMTFGIPIHYGFVLSLSRKYDQTI